MTDQPGLLPCPFCGEELYTCRYDDGKARYAHPANGCIIQRELIYPRSVERWNTRANFAPTVKPLEWYTYRSGRLGAETIIGFYEIDSVGVAVFHGPGAPSFLCDEGEVEDAKLAAQADYKRRILSAFTTAPITPQQATVRAEAVAALESYQQADEDGIMVLVSRQAIEECLPPPQSNRGGTHQ